MFGADKGVVPDVHREAAAVQVPHGRPDALGHAVEDLLVVDAALIIIVIIVCCISSIMPVIMYVYDYYHYHK